MKNKKIAIIGANSFLARNFYHYLMKDSLLKKENVFLYDIQDTSFESETLQYRQLEFTLPSILKTINFTVDAIFFFSGKTGTVKGFDEYEEFININELALLNFLNCYVKKGSKAKIIYPSTRLVYKQNTMQRVTEDCDKKLKSIYAITKFAAEQYVKLYHEIYNINYIIYRIGTPWGTILDNDGNYGTFKFFIDAAKNNQCINIYGDGKIIKTYTHIEDICRIFVASLENELLINHIFNIGGETKSLIEIAMLIAEKYSAKIEYVNWPTIDFKVDGGTVVLDSSKLDRIIKQKYRKIDFSEI